MSSTDEKPFMYGQILLWLGDADAGFSSEYVRYIGMTLGGLVVVESGDGRVFAADRGDLETLESYQRSSEAAA